MDDIYREQILEHYRNPQNYGKLLKADVIIEDKNPLCGDHVIMHLGFDKDKVSRISFEGKGCAISVASASLITEHVKGKTLKEIHSIKGDDVLDILGINLMPARIKCALLPLAAIKKGIIKSLEKDSL